MIRFIRDKDVGLVGLSARLVILFTTAVVAGCGGSSSGTRSASPDGAGGGPALSLSASPATVSNGGFTTLSWTATNARSCEASGGWSGARSTSGSEDVGPITADTTYRMSCSGAAGGTSRQVTVALDSGNGPTVTLTAQPEQVVQGETSTLTWNAGQATSCTAGGGWSGSRATTGTFNTGPLSQTTSYNLTCTSPSGNALASVTVEVLDKILRWQAPTQNVDGTPLTDLAGFNIYWGTESRSYGQNRHTISNPNATEWEVTAPPGTYYFSLTAFDSEGSESGFSNEVHKTIP